METGESEANSTAAPTATGGDGASGETQQGSGGREARRRLLRRLSLVFAAAAVFFAVLAAYSALHGPAGVGGFTYPEKLPDGATVSSAKAGQEAVAAVKSIHWEPHAVEITSAALVSYSDGTLLWLTASPQACSLVDRMAQKIAAEQERLPYTAPVELNVKGVRVYLVADKRTGQIHAFWCRGELAAWAQLGVNPADHDTIARTIKLLVEETSYRG